MSFINWGGESPEQRAARARMEMEALYEQSIRVRIQGQGGTAGSGSAQIPTTESVCILVTKENQANYSYYIADYANAELSGPFTLNVNHSDYYVSASYAINDRGYILLFKLQSDSNTYKAVFIKANGSLVKELSGSSNDISLRTMDGRWAAVYDYDQRSLWYFDGETFVEELEYLQGTDGFSIGSDFDSSCAEGFVLNSTTSNTTTISLATLTGIREIFSYNTVSEPDLSYQVLLYNQSSTMLIIEYDANIGSFSKMMFFNIVTAEQSLVPVDISAGLYTNRQDVALYGEGNYSVIFNNEDNFLLVNYNDLYKSVEQEVIDRTDYSSYYSMYYDNFSLFDCNDYPINNSLAVVFYTDGEYGSNSLIGTTACKVIYTLNNGPLQTDTIKAPGEGVNTQISGISVGKNCLAMLTETGDNEYTVRSIKYSGVSTFPTGISLVDADNWDFIRSGEKNIYKIYKNVDTTEVFVLNSVGTSLTQSTLPTPDLSSYNVDYDVVSLYSNDSTDEWILDNSTDEFVSFPKYEFRSGADSYTNALLREASVLVSVNLGKVSYTHTQLPYLNNQPVVEDFIMDGTVNAGTIGDFGVGASYFTNLYPGLFVLSAQGVDITKFGTLGDIGADGSGTVDSYDYSLTYLGQPYRVFVKRSFYSGDPSINHIIIVKGAATGVTQTVDPNNRLDTHILNGITPDITEIHYLLLAKDNSDPIIEAVISQIVNDYLIIVHGKNIGTALADLNSDYETVTNNVEESLFLFTDYPGQDGPGMISDGGNDMYDGGNQIVTNRTVTLSRIVRSNSMTDDAVFPDSIEDLEVGPNMICAIYPDLNRNGRISVKTYDLSGKLKYTIDTPHYTWDRFFVVGDRMILITSDKQMVDLNKITTVSIYMGTPSTYRSKTFVSGTVFATEQVMVNSATWWS